MQRCHEKAISMEHAASSYLEFRKKFLRPLEKRETRFNDRLAVAITNIVGTMWCAYTFAGLALISLPAAIRGGTATLIGWIAQTFLQLVLLSIIMVGQKVVAAKSDRQLEQAYMDAEALLKISDEIHCLLKQNTELTEGINQVVRAAKKGDLELQRGRLRAGATGRGPELDAKPFPCGIRRAEELQLCTEQRDSKTCDPPMQASIPQHCNSGE